MAIDLDATLRLPKAGIYAFPEDADAIIPTVYGTFLGLPFVPADADDGGFLPATSIDRLNWVFALNSKPILAGQAPQVFVNDTLQDPAVYVFEPTYNYEGLGNIAAIRFLINPASRRISWRGSGTVDSTGALITQPLNAIFDCFRLYGGWTLANLDLPITYESARTLETLGAFITWAFVQERTYREWLQEILKSWFVDYWVTAEGKLALSVDKPMWGLPLGFTVPTVNAQIDLEGIEDDVEFEVDEQNIVNTLEGKRRYKFSTGEYAETATAPDARSVSIYGPLRGNVELAALYTDAHGLAWLARFFGRYAYLPAIIRFTVRGLGLLPSLPGTYLGLLCPWYGWTTPRLVKVLNHVVNYELGGAEASISFEVFDCQRSVDEPITLPSTTFTAVRSRPRTIDSGVDLTPPGPVSSVIVTSLPGRVVLSWTIPGDRDYSHTEIWSSTTNNRATASPVAVGVYGYTYDGLLPATYYVWFVTVDRSLNGQNGTGNWFPVSPTAGIAIAPA